MYVCEYKERERKPQDTKNINPPPPNPRCRAKERETLLLCGEQRIEEMLKEQRRNHTGFAQHEGLFWIRERSLSLPISLLGQSDGERERTKLFMAELNPQKLI